MKVSVYIEVIVLDGGEIGWLYVMFGNCICCSLVD